MKIIQHYAQGGKHKAKNTPCEDRTYSLSANGVTVIALADGAGGKRYTHAAMGAECVTKNISEFFCNNFDRFYDIEDNNEMKSILVGVCHHHLKAAAEELGVDEISKLSSTLLVVAVKDEKAIVCHIGDGVIGKVTTNSTCVVSAPDNGEFANHTFFITNPAAKEHLRIQKTDTKEVVAFFLMSDGTAEYVYDEDAARFHDSARKMSLMAGEENGGEKLADTIEKYMIGPDPTSDDCSFIAMLFNEKVSSIDVGRSKIVYEGEFIQEPKISYEGEVEKEIVELSTVSEAVEEKVPDVSGFVPMPTYNEQSKSKKDNDKVKNFQIISAVLAVLIVAVLVVAIIMGINIKKNKELLESSHSDAKVTNVQKEETKKPSKEEKTTDKGTHSFSPETSSESGESSTRINPENTTGGTTTKHPLINSNTTTTNGSSTTKKESASATTAVVTTVVTTEVTTVVTETTSTTVATADQSEETTA